MLTVELTDPDILESRQIVLKQGTRVKGYAEYSDGIPAGGLDIIAEPDWWHSTTYPSFVKIEPNGFFTLPHIIPGEYSLNIHIPMGEGGGISYPILKTTLPDLDDLITLTVPQRSPAALVSISGTIKISGAPETEATSSVHIEASSREQSHTSTDIWGGGNSFTIDRLEPGNYRLTFSGSNIESKTLENVPAPSENLEVALRYMDKPRLKGVVIRAETGESIKTFRIRATKLKALGGSRYVQPDQWIEFKSPEGSFDTEAIGSGIYQVQVDAEGFAPTWGEQINTEEPSEPVVVALSTGGSIKGTVVDEAGNLISGATVVPLSKACGARWNLRNEFVSEYGAVKTKDGGFLLEHLPPGTETVKVTHPDYSFVVVEEIAVEEGQTTGDVEIALSKGGSAEGYVYNNEGIAQANVTLYFRNDIGFTTPGETRNLLARTITDSNGFYSVKGLPRQMCYVHKAEPWNSLGVVCRALLPVKGKTSQLDFGGEPTITGQLIIDGQPQSNTKVLLGDQENPHLGLFICYSNTNSQGIFSFSGVIPGRYSIYHESKQRRGNWIKAARIETGTENTDIGIIPEITSTLMVYVSNDTNEPNLLVKEFHLEEGTKPWGQRAGQVYRPIAEGEPYIVSDILLGTYTIVISRTDNVMIRHAVDINQQEQTLNLSVPRGTAQISGQYSNINSATAILWRQDRAIVCTIEADENGFFDIKNLPAGEYFIGNSSMLDKVSFMRFNIVEGEHKIIEIVPVAFPALSALLVQVVDENGIPVADASVLVESNGKLIEPLIESTIGKYFVLESSRCTVFAFKSGYNEAMKGVVLEPKDILASPRQFNICYIRLER
jgi:protocatechuate 3,4-dioxygenase beta subunit